MSEILHDEQFSVAMIDEDLAHLKIKNESFVLDYSTLIDFLTQAAVVASRMEKIQSVEQFEDVTDIKKAQQHNHLQESHYEIH